MKLRRIFAGTTRRRPVSTGHSRTRTRQPLSAFPLMRGCLAGVAGPGFEPG